MSLKVVDWCQLLAYTIAYIMCVLCTPLDDELKYEVSFCIRMDGW